MKQEREREVKKPQPTEKMRELGIFSIMGFDSAATFSFRALLVFKKIRKSDKR